MPCPLLKLQFTYIKPLRLLAAVKPPDPCRDGLHTTRPLQTSIPDQIPLASKQLTLHKGEGRATIMLCRHVGHPEILLDSGWPI